MKQKIILVTGGNRGIGKEICRQLAGLGHEVILGSRNPASGKSAAEEMGGNVHAVQLDVTDEASITTCFKWVKSKFDRLDVLINNAGLGATAFQGQSSKIARFREAIPGLRALTKPMVPILRNAGIISKNETAAIVSMDNTKRIMEVNFYGPWRMIQAFVPLLQKSKNGRIINMSSGLGELKSLTGAYPAYSLSKSSLNALTIMLSNELKTKRISVNAMCPGWVKTDMGGPDAPRTVEQGADTAVWLAISENIPTGKFFRDRTEIAW